MALWMDVGPNDVLKLGDGTVITVERKSGARARLKISGPSTVDLLRNAKKDDQRPSSEVKDDGAAT